MNLWLWSQHLWHFQFLSCHCLGIYCPLLWTPPRGSLLSWYKSRKFECFARLSENINFSFLFKIWFIQLLYFSNMIILECWHVFWIGDWKTGRFCFKKEISLLSWSNFTLWAIVGSENWLIYFLPVWRVHTGWIDSICSFLPPPPFSSPSIDWPGGVQGILDWGYPDYQGHSDINCCMVRLSRSWR